jgi:hypothetical protein
VLSKTQEKDGNLHPKITFLTRHMFLAGYIQLCLANRMTAQEWMQGCRTRMKDGETIQLERKADDSSVAAEAAGCQFNQTNF